MSWVARVLCLGLSLATLALARAEERSARLPAGVAVLEADLTQAQVRWQSAKVAGDIARARVSALSEVSQRDRAHSAGLLGAWRLRRGLAGLKEALDTLRPLELAEVAARDELYTVLSGAKAEMDSALEKELLVPGSRRGNCEAWQRERAWWDRKRSFDQALEDLGEGLSQPYALRDLPEAFAARSGQLRLDQRRLLLARQLQLEAWIASLEADWRLLSSAWEQCLLLRQNSAVDASDLQRRRQRAKALLRENRLALSKV